MLSIFTLVDDTSCVQPGMRQIVLDRLQDDVVCRLMNISEAHAQKAGHNPADDTRKLLLTSHCFERRQVLRSRNHIAYLLAEFVRVGIERILRIERTVLFIHLHSQ